MQTLRPMNPITTGKLGKVNYCLKVGQILACLDEAATESGDFTILIKDAPTASPCTRFCLNRQNLLESSILNEEITVPPPANIPTETLKNPRIKIHIPHPALTTHP